MTKRTTVHRDVGELWQAQLLNKTVGGKGKMINMKIKQQGVVIYHRFCSSDWT